MVVVNLSDNFPAAFILEQQEHVAISSAIPVIGLTPDMGDVVGNIYGDNLSFKPGCLWVAVNVVE